ncbi:SMP-30/gluconolactonase/LRE family protein [Phragmitibacter flavus]|uniref:SMP-30/gluconolactonase/LRE family protein n=1 Tax=Phragmitibacter flavus TaxID=2576071 RepID=A0A5R8K8B7_9BACT|nr:SMP-30/gluconolactonase/LRE family protein [Phragmitibacter flavus]TLD68587.1 SMP-30/gluconolactonase/LRE family protein [Phragmitibacter flavus]
MSPLPTPKTQWGEGPIWHKESLYYVDIEGHQVLRYTPSTNHVKTWPTGERVGTVVPRGSTGLVIAGASGFAFLDEVTGEIRPIGDPEADIDHTRFNDGKCDPAGRFWAGTIDLNSPRQPVASLYCLDPELTFSTKLKGVTNSNGLAWTSDTKTFYYIDTPRKNVLAFDYDLDTGTITNERIAFDTSSLSGNPDGMTIDSDDNLWIAFCRAGTIRCINPRTGSVLQEIVVPNDDNVTACAFGGEDLGDLYITSGEHLYVTRPGATGVPAYTFGG